MKHTQTFENFESSKNSSEPINEGANISVRDPYAQQIWKEYQKDILALVAKINKENYDGGSSEIICGGLEEIMSALSNVDDPLRKQMNPND
jgi:hypothetical protein